MTTIAPPLPCAPGDSPFKIKGIAYRGFVHMVERLVPGGVEAIVRLAGDPRLASFIGQPFLAASRYDILPFFPLNAAAAKLLQKPLVTLSREGAYGQARYDAQHVYRAMVEARSLEGLASRLPRFGTQYYNFGEIHGREEGTNHIVIKRRGLPRYIVPWYAHMQAAYMEEIVRQLGARTAVSEPRREISTGTHAGYETCEIDTDVSWSPP